LVVQQTFNLRVAGSNPAGPIRILVVPPFSRSYTVSKESTVNDKQILKAIDNYPADLKTAIDVISDIYCLEYSRVLGIVQNEHGPIYYNIPLQK
jgi:hypothetical protein